MPMSKLKLMFPSLLALAYLTACDAGKPAAQTVAQAQAKVETPDKAAMHAPAGAVPGSHEDWCGGHQVPESLCTRCNSALIPAFKASGDWCESHGLPESQCSKCNPDLKIERPPRTSAAHDD